MPPWDTASTCGILREQVILSTKFTLHSGWYGLCPDAAYALRLLGLHWGMMKGLLRKTAGLKADDLTRTAILRVLACSIAVYGGYAFGKHRIAYYLFLRSMFVFLDYEQPPMQFLAEYLAMMGLWIFFAYYTGKLLQKRTAPAKRKKERNL